VVEEQSDIEDDLLILSAYAAEETAVCILYCSMLSVCKTWQ